MTDITFQLPYYQAVGYASGGKFSAVRLVIVENEEGGIPGYPPDTLADAIRDMLANLTPVTSTALDKYSETITSL